MRPAKRRVLHMATAAAKGSRATVRTKRARVGQSSRARRASATSSVSTATAAAQPNHCMRWRSRPGRAGVPALGDTGTDGDSQRPPRSPPATAGGRDAAPTGPGPGRRPPHSRRRRPSGSAGSSRPGSRTGCAWPRRAAGPERKGSPKRARRHQARCRPSRRGRGRRRGQRDSDDHAAQGRRPSSTTRGWRSVGSPDQGDQAGEGKGDHHRRPHDLGGQVAVRVDGGAADAPARPPAPAPRDTAVASGLGAAAR